MWWLDVFCLHSALSQLLAGISLYMRNALISAITATLVFYSLHNLRDSHMQLPFEEGKLAKFLDEIEGNSKSLAALEFELGELRKSIADIGEAIKADDAVFRVKNNYQEIIQRIESMEDALLESSSEDNRFMEKLHSEPEKNFSARINELDSQASTKQFDDAEDYFNADAGKPISAYTDSIEQHLSSASSLNVNGMDCGKSICKVTYSKPEPFKFNVESDTESELIDKLLFGIEGRDVDLRYADDHYGNRVLYIEMK